MIKTDIFLSNNSLLDIVAATQRWRDWSFLAWHDFILPYRRTIIGPLWQVMQTLVMVAGLYLIFGSTELSETNNYLVYVTSGVVFYGFISNVVTTSANVFTKNKVHILSINVPYVMYIYRAVLFNIIYFLFQVPIVFGVYLITSTVEAEILYVIPGFLMYFITSIWLTLLIAVLGTKYKDLQYLLASLMRFLFFFSPIFWVPVGGSLRETFSIFNPITYFFEILRAPFLGKVPSIEAWLVVLSINIVGIIVTFFVFNNSRSKLPFWL